MRRREALANRMVEVPLTGNIAIDAVALRDLGPDPADRLILASAVAEQATLVTADEQLLRWKGKLPRLDAAS